MVYNKNEDLKTRQAVKRVISEYLEKLILVAVILLGSYLIYKSQNLSEFWPSLYLNLGSNMVVFVFLFWIFQYFTDKQPGDDYKENYESYRNIIDSTAEYQQNDIITQKPSRKPSQSKAKEIGSDSKNPNTNNTGGSK